MTWYAYSLGMVKHAADWYHGSARNFDRFELGRSRTKQYGPKHWNSHLGTHFTSEHNTAYAVANEAIGHDPSNGDATIYHCALDMKNPRHYESEFDLDRHAHKWASKHPVYREHLDNWADKESALRKHPYVDQLAQDFREHLEGQGYDGVTYGNEYEGSHLHKCAIAFRPEDISIKHAHGIHDDCPDKTSAVDEYHALMDTFGALTQHFAGAMVDLDPDKVAEHAEQLQAHLEEHHPHLLDKPQVMHDSLHRAEHTKEGQGWGSGKVGEDAPLSFHTHHPLIDPSVSKVHRLSLEAVLAYSGAHGVAEDRREGHPRGGPGLDQPRGLLGDAGPRPRGREGLRLLAGLGPHPGPLTWHPRAKKEYSKLDKPSQKAVDTTIAALQRGDENLQSHQLRPPLTQWNSTKASRGHRIVHQKNDDGGLHIGAISLHDYGEAERRLGGRQRGWVPEPAPEGLHSYYRGIYLGGDTKSEFVPPKPGEPGIGHSIPVPADHSDQGILDRLRSHHEYRVRTNQIDAEPHPLRAMYGSHWTSDPSLAHRFAFDQTHGQYRVPPVPTRATTGVVLEMQSKVPPERDRLSSQFGETEVKWPGREHVERVLAHVHRYDPAVHGEGPMNFHRADTYVRSFEIPQEHLKKHAGKERVKVYRGLYLADEPETYEGEVRRRFDHREPVGSHWSTDPDVAKSFALDYMHGAGGAGMVLHGEVDAEHVVDRSEIHRDRGVMSPNHFEREHYVRPGAPIDVHQTSVHWHHPEEYDEETGTSKDDFEDEAHEKHDPPLRVHANSTDDIMDLLGPPVKPAAPPEPDADEKHQQRIADHKAWQDSRPGLNPGDDISKHQMGKEYPTAEWVPIEVAQRFRDHRGDQHAGSEETVHDIHRQLESGRGMTDPLMLLHHNEDQRAHLGEGNHRLVAAERAGWTHVPMRVVRMYDSESEAGKGQLIPSRWRNREYRGRTPEMAKPSEVFHPDLFKHDRMTKQGIALEWEVIQRDARTRILDSGPDGQEATGIMVAIVPPKRVAKSLEIEDGEPHEQLHVTLAFLGDTSDYTDDQLFDLPEVVAAWAETQPQTLAKTQGAGTFTPHTEGGKHVLWAAVEIPGVHRMHQSLIEHLKAHGYKPKEDFEYQPHLTLAYSKYHWRFIPKVTRQEWKVREVWLAVGGKWETHRLGS